MCVCEYKVKQVLGSLLPTKLHGNKAFHTYTALSNQALKDRDWALIGFKLGTSGSWLSSLRGKTWVQDLVLTELFVPSCHRVSWGLKPIRLLLWSAPVHPTPTSPRHPPCLLRPSAPIIRRNVCSGSSSKHPPTSSFLSHLHSSRKSGGKNLTEGGRGIQRQFGVCPFPLAEVCSIFILFYFIFPL